MYMYVIEHVNHQNEVQTKTREPNVEQNMAIKHSQPGKVIRYWPLEM